MRIYSFGFLLLLGLAACQNGYPPPPTEIRVVTSEAKVEASQTAATAQATLSAQPTQFTNTSAAPRPSAIGQGVVIGEDAVVFADPHTESAELGSLPQNTRVDVLAETPPNRIGIVFYQISYEDLTGWVASTQIQPVQDTAQAATATPSPAPPTALPTATFPPTFTPTITPSPLPAGFPTPQRYSLVVVEQIFEGGRMLWLEPLRQVWVLEGDEIDPQSGTWMCFTDTFVEGQPERDPLFDPPADLSTASQLEGAVLMQPIRGFGKIWRENFTVREALGWALVPETLHTTRYEYFAGGSMNNGTYRPSPGEIRLESLYQYTLVFTEDTIQAPCETKTGTWKVG